MLAALLLAVLVRPALAQEDDDLDDLDDDIELGDAPAPKPAPADPDDTPPTEGDDEDDGLDDFRDPDADDDLLGDEPVNPDSGDTEAVFRAAQTRLQKLDPDEELAGWEAYLEQYPSSAYRKRIETRMEELTDAIYENGAGPTGTGPSVDALDAEIGFAQPMQLENIDPRSRIQVGFEWGLPNYVNLIGDVEYQLARTFSIHAGVRRRYLGWNVEAGARWALVKSRPLIR